MILSRPWGKLFMMGSGLFWQTFLNQCDIYSDHPLSALSHGNVSVVSSFNHTGDAFSDCVNGDRTK